MPIFPFLSEGRPKKVGIHVEWTMVFFTVFLQGCINSPAIFHILLIRDLGHLDFLLNMTLIYYMDDIILIRPDEQKVASILEAIIISMHCKR